MSPASPASPVSGAGLQNAVLGFTGFFFIILLILGILIYFIPSFIAMKKQHPQKVAILLLNIFLGWTFIGWVGALIWAVSNPQNVNTKKIE